MFARNAPANRPARYFPPGTGKYELTPGLFAFGHDFGNGFADRQLFQLDMEFQRYRENKLQARSESLNKYVMIDALPRDLVAVLTSFVSERLVAEHPDYFELDSGDGEQCLHCALTGESLLFDTAGTLRQNTNPVGGPPYLNGIDALACQVQEDLAVMVVDTRGQDRLAGLHLCAPNHWAPAEKIGGNLESVHRPVPLFAETNRHTGRLAQAMIRKGPYVRFAWGLAADTRLNHHPDPPPGQSSLHRAGRDFGSALSGLYLRTERQVIWGFPQLHAALFTIRTGFQVLTDLDETERIALKRALQGMHENSAQYKGLNETMRTRLIDQLGSNEQQ